MVACGPCAVSTCVGCPGEAPVVVPASCINAAAPRTSCAFSRACINAAPRTSSCSTYLHISPHSNSLPSSPPAERPCWQTRRNLSQSAAVGGGQPLAATCCSHAKRGLARCTNGTALHRKHARETGRTCARRPNRRGGPNGAAAPTAPSAIRMATLAHRCTVQQWRLRPDAPQCRRRAHIAWLARRAGCTAALSALASPGSLAYVA